jgi:hypothetical protein
LKKVIYFPSFSDYNSSTINGSCYNLPLNIKKPTKCKRNLGTTVDVRLGTWRRLRWQ